MDKPLNAEFIAAINQNRPVEEAAGILRAQLDKAYKQRMADIDEQTEIARYIQIGMDAPKDSIPYKISQGYLKEYEAARWKK